jgi:hypothetical protein
VHSASNVCKLRVRKKNGALLGSVFCGCVTNVTRFSAGFNARFDVIGGRV